MKIPGLARIAFAVALLAASGVASAPKDTREMQAREAYAAGRYQEALDLFVKLYAEKLHPNYLRNIARCYQNLGEPDKAISEFREYLRKARNLSDQERGEIQGYIREMEDLKRQRDAAAAPPPPPARAVAEPAQAEPPPRALPVAEPPPQQAQRPALAVGAADAAVESPPVYTRWWFWTAIGAVAAGAVVAAVVASKGGSKADPSCPAGFQCK